MDGRTGPGRAWGPHHIFRPPGHALRHNFSLWRGVAARAATIEVKPGDRVEWTFLRGPERGQNG